MPRTMTARLGTLALITGFLVTSSSTSSQAAGEFEPWGSATSKNHVLKRGCHDYTYRYRVNPPTDNWSAEVFVVGRKRLGIGSNYLVSSVDGARGTKQITVCRDSAPFGRYQLKMKVTWTQDREITTGFVKPTSFRFTRPR